MLSDQLLGSQLFLKVALLNMLVKWMVSDLF